MEIRSKQHERGPVIATVLALIFLGLGSLFLTWQNIKRQREFVEEHMVLSGTVVLRGVQANLIRVMRGLINNPLMASLFPALAEELFQEISSSEGITFVGLFGPRGKRLVSSSEMQYLGAALPEKAMRPLHTRGRWNGMVSYNGRNVMVSALRIEAILPRFWREDPLASEDTTVDKQALYLVVGLNIEKHLTQFKLYRRAALLQTGYVFSAAVVLWFLAFAYLRRREQGQRLGRLERFQSKLLDNMPDGIVTLGPDGEILALNGPATRIMDPEGRSGELTGKSWAEFPFADLILDHQWRQYDYEGKRIEALSVHFQADLDDEPGEEQRLVLLRDRTKIKSLEEDLIEARRLAAIGSLAAGVAHEVRNPLSSLRGFAQFFADKLKNEQPYASYAKTMVQEADRLNRVVTDLLFLAKPRTLAPETLNLEDFLSSLERLMRFDLDHKEIVPMTALDAETVYADPDALKQVLLNLFANSLDALEDSGGEICVTSRHSQGGVWLTVEDNGSGMPEDIREQALEPFFTAKEKGTGLGLSIVQTIMLAHKGRITISSDPDQGTRINLFFPDKPDSDDEMAPGRQQQNEQMKNGSENGS